MMPDNFAALILTHGRPSNVITYKTLALAGYTGRIVIVCDTDDETLPEYERIYGKENVRTFNKADYTPSADRKWDTADNFKHTRGSILFARNAAYDIAEDMGLEYFIQLDDDYTEFWYRNTDDMMFTGKPIKNLDAVLSSMLDFYINAPSVMTIAMAQGGDMIGGKDNRYNREIVLHRKAMNTFICSPKRRIRFIGRINEDVSAYTLYGRQGLIFFTQFVTMITQMQTQAYAGGMTELYKANGTYIKSFYTVMYAPSCCKIGMLGETYRRLHHSLSWNNLCPKIMSEDYRKKSQPATP